MTVAAVTAGDEATAVRRTHRALQMRAVMVVVALVVGVLATTNAAAYAESSETPETFTGSCKLEGNLWQSTDYTNVLNASSLWLEAAGTCVGLLGDARGEWPAEFSGRSDVSSCYATAYPYAHGRLRLTVGENESWTAYWYGVEANSSGSITFAGNVDVQLPYLSSSPTLEADPRLAASFVPEQPMPCATTHRNWTGVVHGGLVAEAIAGSRAPQQ